MTGFAELPALVAMDVAGRVGSVRAALVEATVDALWVTKPANVRWLTGFTGSNGQILVTATSLLVVTDGRYRIQVAQELEAAGVEAEVEITSAGAGDVLDRVVASSAALGFESHHLTWDAARRLGEWLPGRTLTPLDQPIEKLRRPKDPGERSRLVRAAAIADRALADTVPLLADRPTERVFARRLDNAMIELGADEPSYETIVASGPNGALPHARPTRRVIEPGDLVVIDVGARVEGYGSDMTRTFVVGGDPTPEQQRMYDAVIESQAAGVAAVRAGEAERTIHETCRDVLAHHGLADAFIHGTGHGIGLEIHEEPILSARSVGILQSGLVVTVEPGVYVAAVGGVRIEDSVVVDEHGCEPITHSPKTLAA